MENKLDTIRNYLLNTSLLIFALYAIPFLMFSLYRITIFGWQPLFLVHIIVTLLGWGIYLLRARLSFTLRFALYMVGWLGAAFTGALQFGLLGAWPISLVFFPILATLFYKQRVGIWATVAIGLSISLVAGLFRQGVLHVAFDPMAYMERYTSWLFLIASFVVTVLSLVYPVGKMKDLLIENTSELRAKSVALEQSQEELSQTLAFLPVAVGISDLEGHVLHVNHAFQETFGYTLADMSTLDTWYQLAYPDPAYRKAAVAKWTEDIALARAGGYITPVKTYQITTQHGQVLDVELSARIVGNRVITVFNDVTARIRAESYIRHLNVVLRSIRNINQLITHEKNQERLIQQICQELTQTRGYSTAWLILLDEAGDVVSAAKSGIETHFQAFLACLKEKDTPVPACVQQALAASGVMVFEKPYLACAGCPLLNIESEGNSMATRLEHYDRVYGLLSASVPSTFVIDAEEEALFGEVAGDIAFALYNLEAAEEKKHTEELLRQERLLLRTVIDNLPDAVYAKDTQGRKTLANFADLNNMGASSEEEVLGKTDYDLFPPDVAARFAAYDQQILQTGQPQLDIEELLVNKQGRRAWLLTSKLPLRDSQGHIVGLVGIGRDITDYKQTQEALRVSEMRYQELVERMPSGVAVYKALPDGQDFVFVDFNRAGEQLENVSREDLIGRRVTEVFPGIVAYGLLDVFREVWQTGEPRQHPLSLYRGQHLTGWRENYVYKLPTGEIVSIYRDETARKQAEQALRDSEQRFRSIVENTEAGYFFIDKEGLIQDVNPAWVKLYRYDAAEEIIGQHFTVIQNIEDVERAHEFVEGILRGDPEYLTGEFSRKCKDGTIGYHTFSARPVSRLGEVVGLEGFLIDTTEHKKAEEERERLLVQLREAAQRVQQIMDTVPEGVLLLGPDLRVLSHNPVAAAYWPILMGAQDAPLLDTVVTHLGDCPIKELLTSPPQGLWHEVTTGQHHFQAIARPIEAGPTVGGWVLVIRDVTEAYEIRENMQRQERLATVGQLAAGIAHDFNNILAGIVLYAQMSLQMPDISLKLRERLQLIVEQSHCASDLINQILDFGRRAVLDRRALDMAQLLQEQIKLWKRTLPENIRISFTHSDDALIVKADMTRMQQMMMNLVVNARDAMPEGGELHIDVAPLHITSARDAPVIDMLPGDWVQITVADTGFGIPEDVLPHIFDPFFSTKPPGKGTGLGLAQVYGIVTSHDGHIEVKTQIDKGSTFIVYLPALRTQVPDKLDTYARDLQSGHGETILVVEDNATTREAVVSSLEMLNYQVLQAANGKAALEVYAQHRDTIALVLSDWVMPEMGGKVLARMLHEQDPRVRVVVMSGHPLERDENVSHKTYILAWIQKPPTLEQLAEVLAQALR